MLMPKELTFGRLTYALAGFAIGGIVLALALHSAQTRSSRMPVFGSAAPLVGKVEEVGRRLAAEVREASRIDHDVPYVPGDYPAPLQSATCYAIPIAAYRVEGFDEARALDEVRGVLAQFGLGDLKVVVSREPVLVGGRRYMRVMAGTFKTAEDARARCVAVKGVDAKRWCEPLALAAADYPCET
ncbi:MAG TPA: hypothetical protein PK264_22070 [Hyphomicrobiaceae bacterium]|nr:hypothetical protein [Hyphomicrobiaceae bacterium]